MKHKITGMTRSGRKDIESGEEVVICGKCGERQNIFFTRYTGFVEELDFICNSCGERNTISAY